MNERVRESKRKRVIACDCVCGAVRNLRILLTLRSYMCVSHTQKERKGDRNNHMYALSSAACHLYLLRAKLLIVVTMVFVIYTLNFNLTATVHKCCVRSPQCVCVHIIFLSLTHTHTCTHRAKQPAKV